MSGDLQRLRELFASYEEEFLRSVYVQSGNSLERSVEHLLEFSRTHGGMPSTPHYVGTPEPSDPLGLLSQAAMMTSSPSQPQRNSNAMMPNVVEMKKAQLQQVQRYLFSKGLPSMSPEERKQYLTSNPAALAELKQFLTSIGLGNYNFGQLQQYFKESGLTLALTSAPQVPRDPLIRQLLSVEGRNYDRYNFTQILSPSQKQQFRDNGFLLVPNVVPRASIEAALRDINRSMRNGYSREKMTWCPDVVAAPSILDLLYQTPVLAYVMSLTGPVARVNEGSIDLSFPGMGCVDRADERFASHIPPNAPVNYYVPDPTWQRNWQVDDLHYPVRGQARNYTLLAAVMLSDIPQALLGNPTIYPRTHHAFQDVMQRAGGAQRFLEQHGVEELRRQIPARDPTQIAANAGDVLLMHYGAAHTTAPNIGSNVRYMVFFRLYQAGHVPGVFRPEAMDRIWLEFEGLQEARGGMMVVQPPQRMCGRCNQPSDPSARFCPFCGSPLV